MDYPSGFPDHLKFPVDTAFSNSEIEFARLRKQETSKDDGLRHIERYIRSVFFAFAKAACKAVEEGLWSAEQFRRETDKYRDDLAHHVYFDKIFWTATSEELARLKRSVKLQIESMDEWARIQNELKDAILTVEAVRRSPRAVPVTEPGRYTMESEIIHARKSNDATRIRATATITSEAAARRMEAYMDSKGIGQTEFAQLAGTTDRTLRTFRKTGKIRRGIFDGIASAMGLTRDELLAGK